MNCKIGNCDNEAAYPILGVCSACYSGLAYWRGRSVYDKRKRLKQTERLTSRMEHMIDKPHDAPKRKRKA
jgi:hypothetical protein